MGSDAKGGRTVPEGLGIMSTSGTARGPSLVIMPDGDNRERMTCPDCGFIAYENPKIVVGALCRWGERILLVPPGHRAARRLSGPCRRVISN